MGILYSLLLFTSPLIYLPFIPFSFELPKVIFVQILVFIIAAKTVNKIDKKQILNNRAVLLLPFLFVYSLFTFLLFPQSASFFGNPYRLQGELLFITVLIFAFCTAVQVKIPIRKPLSAFSLLILGISAYLILHPVTGRAVGTLGEPNALSTSAVFLFPFGLLISKKMAPYKFLMFIFYLAVTIVIIFLSGSRAGFIALSIQLIYLLTSRFIKVPWLALSVAVFLLCFSFLLPSLESKGVYENRLEIWSTATVAGFENPILGNGVGNIEESLRAASISRTNNIRFQTVDSSHNIFLDYFVQLGLPGCIAFILLLTSALIRMESKHRSPYVAMLLGVVTALSFNPASVASLAALWWLIGTGIGNLQDVKAT